MKIRGAVSDFLIFAGFGGVIVGAWQVYPPAAFIVGGALVLLAGLRSRPPEVKR